MLAHMDELVSRNVSGSSVTARYHGLGWTLGFCLVGSSRRPHLANFAITVVNPIKPFSRRINEVIHGRQKEPVSGGA